MVEVPSRTLPALIRLTGRGRELRSRTSAQRHVERLRLRPRPFGPPRRLRGDVRVAVDHQDGWPVYELTPAGGGAGSALVYLHGGGWVNEIAPAHWRLAAQIAAEAKVAVTVPIYPLVPFATAAQVLPVVVGMVRSRVARFAEVALGGDSAGGQIALSAAVRLRDDHDIVLPRTVLISPVLDLALQNPAIDLVESRDPWLSRPGIEVLVEYWRGDLPLSDVLVSPLRAEMGGLGPLTVFSGTRDLLNPDARLLTRRASDAGVDVDYHQGPGLVHVYPLTPTPEGRAARRVIVDSLRRRRRGPTAR